jgi:hypothetical protein
MRRKVFVSALSLTALISIGILLMSCSAGAIRELIGEVVEFFDANIKPGTPIPIAPGEGDDLSSRDVTFTWEGSNNAINYEIQVSTSDTFSSTVYSEPATTLTTSSATLVNDGTYFWRVRAQGASTLYGNYSAWKQFTIAYDAEAIKQPELIAPGMGDELLPGPVNFSWGAVDNAIVYYLQVSQTSDFTTLLVNEPSLDATTYESSSFADGKYYWRVAASNGSGWIWSTTYAFAVATKIGVPKLYSPKYGETLTTNKPSFSWSAVSGASAYEIWVASDEKFVNLIIKDRTKDTIYESGVAFPNGKYLWMVRAQAFNGEWGEWSKYYAFAVEYEAGALDPPKPIAPEYGQKFVPGNIDFLWTEVDGATGYSILIAADPLFEKVLAETKTKSPAYSMIFEKYAEYFWKVFAFNDTLKSPWSKVFTFAVGPIGSPTLYAPVGEVVTTSQPEFSWSKVEGAAGYCIQISGNDSFTSIIEQDKEVLSNKYQMINVLKDGTYYWRVMARDAAGNWSKWSEIAKFGVDAALPVPKPPVLSSPVDGGTLTSTAVTFSWASSSEATSYIAQASYYSTFSTLIFDKKVTATSTSYTFAKDGTYYWRVCANNASGSSSFSQRKFYIKTVTYPDPPKLVSPIKGAVAGNPIPFAWSAVTGATSYAIEVAFDKGFEKFAAKGEIVGGTSCTEGDLDRKVVPLEDGVYWWRAYSYNGTYYSKPSEPSYFTKDSQSSGENLLLNGDFEKKESFEADHNIYDPDLLRTNFPQNGNKPIKPVTILTKVYALDTYWFRALYDGTAAGCKGITYDDTRAVHGGTYGLSIANFSDGQKTPYGGYYEQVVKVEGHVSVDGYFKEISRDGYGGTGIQFEWLVEGKPVLAYRVFVDNLDKPIEEFGWYEGWFYNEKTGVWYYGERYDSSEVEDWIQPAEHTLNDLKGTATGVPDAADLIDALISKEVVDGIRVRLLVAPIGTSTLAGGFDDISVEYE